MCETTAHGRMKPCIETGCTQPAINGPRCEPHRLGRNRRRDKQRGMRHYTPAERRRMAAHRATYYADPNTRCWICHGLLNDKPGGWTADHLDPGVEGSPLAPAHKPCNSSRGNKPQPQ